MHRLFCLLIVASFLALPAAAADPERDLGRDLFAAIADIFADLFERPELFDKAGPMCDPFGQPTPPATTCELNDDGDGATTAPLTEPTAEPIDESH